MFCNHRLLKVAWLRFVFDRAIVDYGIAITFSDFNRAIKLDPRYASPYGNRGNLRFARGDFDGAIADHTCAIDRSPA